MNFSNIISEMTWSYSRITTFESCPYQFFLSYIKRLPKKRMFFSDYGTLIHKIIELYLLGALKQDDLVPYYLYRFRADVAAAAPSKDIYTNYFQQGLQYLQSFSFPYRTILGVEKRADFSVEGLPFTGIIDCEAEDGGIVIVDNKSRALKPRSKRKKPTKSDMELDAYLRQLYLYSLIIKEQFHTYPTRLEFNCFRTGTLISEPFRMDALEQTKDWAIQSVQTITKNEDWSPNMDYWKCRYLCDLNEHCEYYQMNKG